MGIDPKHFWERYLATIAGGPAKTKNW
jgi:hypothetical protein